MTGQASTACQNSFGGCCQLACGCWGRDEETAAWVATAAARQPSGRRHEKENMAAFLAKKREIFLVQVRTCCVPCFRQTHGMSSTCAQ